VGRSRVRLVVVGVEALFFFLFSDVPDILVMVDVHRGTDGEGALSLGIGTMHTSS
jgi:hypothetical protein